MPDDALPTERAVEVPWVLDRYRGEERVLDVGSAFAEPDYLAALSALGAKHLVGVDAASVPPRPVPFPLVRGDLRDLPFSEQTFDLVLCVSTLEHVGRDNSIYGLPNERDPSAALSALREIRRVLTDAGRLLLTVPCGESEDHGWFVQEPPAIWLEALADSGFAAQESEVYVLGRWRKRWRRARRFRSRGVRYATRGPAASAVLCVCATKSVSASDGRVDSRTD